MKKRKKLNYQRQKVLIREKNNLFKINFKIQIKKLLFNNLFKRLSQKYNKKYLNYKSQNN